APSAAVIAAGHLASRVIHTPFGRQTRSVGFLVCPRRRWTPSERPRGGGEDGRVGGGHRAAAPRATERRGGQRPVPGASASAPSPRRDPRERLPHRCASCSGGGRSARGAVGRRRGGFASARRPVPRDRRLEP